MKSRLIRFLLKIYAKRWMYRPNLDTSSVRSVCIASACYDPQTEVLTLEYYNGLIYQVPGVPSEVGLELIGSDHFDQDLKRVTTSHSVFKCVGRRTPILFGT